MRASLAQIEAFYWIARLGGFHSAAAYLNLAQPTVSLRIRTLEASLGIKLFERGGRRVRLTSEATILLPQADRIMAIADKFSSRPELNDPLRGHLRLGAPDVVGLTCMPALLQSLRESYPELNVALSIDNSAVLGRRLNDRELDIAFLADPRVDSHVRTELMGAMDIAWVAGRAMKLPATATPRDLVDLDILTNPAPSNLMQLVQSWFAAASLSPSRVSTCNSLSVILRLAAAGTGIALLPTAILRTDAEARQLRVLRTKPAIPSERLFAAYLIDKAGPGVTSILATARHVIAQSRLLA
jgi:DNA-binding transcriptional LysR family regulator